MVLFWIATKVAVKYTEWHVTTILLCTVSGNVKLVEFPMSLETAQCVLVVYCSKRLDRWNKSKQVYSRSLMKQIKTRSILKVLLDKCQCNSRWLFPTKLKYKITLLLPPPYQHRAEIVLHPSFWQQAAGLLLALHGKWAYAIMICLSCVIVVVIGVIVIGIIIVIGVICVQLSQWQHWSQKLYILQIYAYISLVYAYEIFGQCDVYFWNGNHFKQIS